MNRVSHKTGRRGRRTVAAVAAMLVAGGLAAAPLAADASRSGELRATGLASNGTKLVRFDTDRPSSVSRSERIAGLSGDSRLIGIDFRVQNGRLYGVGNAGGIYLIGSGASASKVGQLSVGLTGTNFGVDFNPAANALRVISDTGQNLRQPFGTGDAPTGATAADGTLTYPATPTTPATTATGVTGAAYTNNDLDPDTATTLFDIDTRLDQVVLQVPANAGTLSPTGKLGIDAGANAGFDIYSTIRDGRTVAVQGFATLATNNRYRLYSVNLLTGEVSSRGSFPYAVTDIAIGLNQR